MMMIVVVIFIIIIIIIIMIIILMIMVIVIYNDNDNDNDNDTDNDSNNDSEVFKGACIDRHDAPVGWGFCLFVFHCFEESLVIDDLRIEQRTYESRVIIGALGGIQ